MDRDPIIARLSLLLLSTRERIACAYLFGSLARGNPRVDSDIDIAVLFDEPPPRTLLGPVSRLQDELEHALQLAIQAANGSLALVRAWLLAFLCCGTAVAQGLIAPFSAMPVGPVPEGAWTETRLPNVEPARMAIVDAAGERVLRIDADAAASSLALPLSVEVAGDMRLSWRWKVANVVQRGDIATKAGDDLAARLYVFFDPPMESLTLAQRTKLRLARWLYDGPVPAAALCYVWGNAEPVGTSAWSAYTDRVRVIVLRNADDPMDRWQVEQRDVAADFERAFAMPAPPISGLAVAADTDQTGERVTAWFGDIRLERASGGAQDAP
jgi:predicted nucleotidyltransferase